MRKSLFASALVASGASYLGVVAPAHAVSVTINDAFHSDLPGTSTGCVQAGGPGGTVPDGISCFYTPQGATLSDITSSVVQESVGVRGQANFSFAYHTTDLQDMPAIGFTRYTLVNYPEAFNPADPFPLPGTSDTLQIALSGISGSSVDPNANVLVNLRFISDSIDQIPPTALDCSTVQPLPGQPATSNPPPGCVLLTREESNVGDIVPHEFTLADLTIIASSDVPEPASWTMFALGLTGLLGLGIMRRWQH
jgi:hypothetical protein